VAAAMMTHCSGVTPLADSHAQTKGSKDLFYIDIVSHPNPKLAYAYNAVFYISSVSTSP
jgi:hypothetical protein